MGAGAPRSCLGSHALWPDAIPDSPVFEQNSPNTDAKGWKIGARADAWSARAEFD